MFSVHLCAHVCSVCQRPLMCKQICDVCLCSPAGLGPTVLFFWCRPWSAFKWLSGPPQHNRSYIPSLLLLWSRHVPPRLRFIILFPPQTKDHLPDCMMCHMVEAPEGKTCMWNSCVMMGWMARALSAGLWGRGIHLGRRISQKKSLVAVLLGINDLLEWDRSNRGGADAPKVGDGGLSCLGLLWCKKVSIQLLLQEGVPDFLKTVMTTPIHRPIRTVAGRRFGLRHRVVPYFAMSLSSTVPQPRNVSGRPPTDVN